MHLISFLPLRIRLIHYQNNTKIRFRYIIDVFTFPLCIRNNEKQYWKFFRLKSLYYIPHIRFKSSRNYFLFPGSDSESRSNNFHTLVNLPWLRKIKVCFPRSTLYQSRSTFPLLCTHFINSIRILGSFRFAFALRYKVDVLNARIPMLNERLIIASNLF